MATRPHAGTFQNQRRNSSVDLEAEAPFIAWPEMYEYLRANFKQGDHVAILGPTGTGKTHIALAMAELRTYVIVVACKPKDPLVTDAIAHGYFLIPGNELEVPYVDNKPLHKKVIYWPRMPNSTRNKIPQHLQMRAERNLHKPLVGGALGYVRNNGHWALVIDEGTYVCRDLRLQADIDSALQHFRTLDSSIIILGQRPAWMGRYVLSQPTHLFLFNTRNRDDRKSLGDISGVDPREIEEIVRHLDRDKFEALYIDTRKMTMYRTIAPPR